MSSYRCQATSVQGFLQVLACNYLPHGYWFYVAGIIPEEKNPEIVDQKLIDKYGIAVSRQSRLRRKKAGLANLHYLRYGRFWLLLATPGTHHFFDHERKNIRDARRVPILFKGYSIALKQGGWLRKSGASQQPARDKRLRVCVQIARETYKDLKAHFLAIAAKCSAKFLERELYRVPFEPYARIRQQLFNVLRLVNRARHEAGQDRIRTDAIRCRRHIVKPFDLEVARRQLPTDRRVEPEQVMVSVDQVDHPTDPTENGEEGE